MIALPELISFGGSTVIEGNGQLKSIFLPICDGMLSAASMTIRNSASLESLNFPGLDCGYIANFILENNPKLVNVTIPEGCTRWFASINNPELKFIEI